MALPTGIDLSSRFAFSLLNQILDYEKEKKKNYLLINLAFALQILKENKDKKDAEFNERFKHSEYSIQPPFTISEDSLFL